MHNRKFSLPPSLVTGTFVSPFDGRFQKISIPYHGRLLGYPKGRGGSHGILRAWGVFTIRYSKALVNSTGGISGVESVE